MKLKQKSKGLAYILCVSTFINQLNIISADQYGQLCANIISSKEIVLTEEKYNDVLNLNNMKERGTIEEFMFDMQKSQILGLKYLPKE